MIISRTPFRVSFFGGGTDYPVWFKSNQGGAVLSTTINKYCYISCRPLPPFFQYKYLIRYRLREEVRGIDEIEHPSVKQSLKYMNINNGVEIVHTSDLPARSGIGSSSAFTVGLLNTLSALKGEMITKRQLASSAIHIEQNLIKEKVGSQDQVAAAFGGLNKIEFHPDNSFYVQPITIKQDKLNALQNHLMFFFSGQSRIAEEVAAEQIKNTDQKQKQLLRIREMVDEAVNLLNGGSDDINDFGKLLHDAWKLKRTLSKRVSPRWIDQLYELAMKNGATGGKLCGAGGGGFLLLFVPPDRQENLIKKMDKALHVPFSFEKLGSQIILYETKDSLEK